VLDGVISFKKRKCRKIMARHRSPNYPQFSLREALDKVRKVYEAEHTHPAAKEVIVQDLGYSGLNGASAVAIGSLNRYGLLEQAGEGLRVSDAAVAALELSKGDPTHDSALRSLALTPTLFAELNRQFGNRLPSETSLRHSLIKQGFLPKAAEDVIRIYRDNLELVGEDSNEYNESIQTQNSYTESRPTESGHVAPTRAIGGVSSGVDGLQSLPSSALRGERSAGEKDELRFRLSPNSIANVVFDGPITQQAVAKLIALLELSKDTFPELAEWKEDHVGETDTP
jgi:hypothetical protein